MNLRTAACLSLALLAGACSTSPAGGAARSDVLRVIVVRHAEKTDDGSRDPALNAKGQARAQALRETMADESLLAAYSTDFQRARQTAQPAAQAHRIEVTTYDARQPTAEFAAQLRRRHASGAVLVVGHSNTVPGIVAALCGCEAPPLDETEYDRLSIVEIATGKPPRLVRRRYGSPEREAVAGADFEMGAGEQVSLGGLGMLRYDKLVGDSRCPPDVQCIWAGDADLQFSWMPNGGKAESFSLHTGAEPRDRALAGYVLELKSLGRGDDPRAALKLRAAAP